MTFSIKVTGYRRFGNLGLTKQELRDTAKSAYLAFIGSGGTITQCRPAFAHGIETPLVVRQAIRKEGLV